MRFRRTPQERLDLALARLIERDIKVDTPAALHVIEWSREAASGEITIVASNRRRESYQT